MKRYVSVTPHISISFAMAFIGENARAIRDRLSWNPDFRHHKNAEGAHDDIHKLYFPGELATRGVAFYFDYPQLITMMGVEEITEDFCEWNWLRTNEVRAVCAPRPIPREYLPADVLAKIDIEKAEKSCWGFGRPNYYKPDLNPALLDQRFSGPVVDRSPDTPKSRELNWKFRPLYMKVESRDGDSYIAKFEPHWETDGVTMEAIINPSDAPQEITDYKFSERPQDDERAAALIESSRNAVRSRKAVR